MRVVLSIRTVVCHLRRKSKEIRNRMSTQIDPILHQIADRLGKKFELDHVEPIHATARVGKNPEFMRTYYLSWLNGRKIFIKHFGNVCRESAAKKEFRFTHLLHSINANNFPEALFYSCVEHYRCVAFEFLEGETLGSKMRSARFSASERECVILQLKEIAKSLVESGIVHTDLGLSNFFITKDGLLKLIDFGGAVDSKRYEKLYAVRKNPVLLLPLWGTRLVGKCYSDDMVWLLEILEKIGCQESYQETYHATETFLKDHVREKSIRHKLRQFKRTGTDRMLRKLEYRIKMVMRPLLYRLKRIVRLIRRRLGG